MSEAGHLSWGHKDLTVEFEWDDHSFVRIASVEAGGPGSSTIVCPRTPLIEIRTVSEGPTWPGGRVTDTVIGSQLRYVDHRSQVNGTRHDLEIDLLDSASGVAVRFEVRSHSGVSAFQARASVRNISAEEIVLLEVSSLVVGFSWDRSTVRLFQGDSAWTAEHRWRSYALTPHLLPELPNGREALWVRSEGNWSTGTHVPMGVLSTEAGLSAAWEVASPSSWRWGVSGLAGGGLAVAMEGPSDAEGLWSQSLEAGDAFTTVWASMSVAVGQWQRAVAVLTQHRRAERTPHWAFQSAPVVFNDYLKALEGDPTEATLEPLILSAAEAGAEVFCIDAGWYDDAKDGWWRSVGAWQPSNTRFPSGLERVLGRIRESGMIPGLWVEPEVVGVESPLVGQLPQEAFFCRRGERLEEAGRYHLDFSHPAARRHLDVTIDRLVALGAGYFKFDYNIQGAHGTDTFHRAPGGGRLEHARSYLDWIETILKRHPDILIENCASGGMRADAETLKHFQLQQSSDNEDTAMVLPISAASLMAIPPEQLAMWCYPDPGTSPAETRMALAAATVGRFHLSGTVSALNNTQQKLLHLAIAAHKEFRGELFDSEPVWPCGLPTWDATNVVFGVRAATRTRIVVARRLGGEESIRVPLENAPRRVVSVLGHEDGDGWVWEDAEQCLVVRLGEIRSAMVLDLF